MHRALGWPLPAWHRKYTA